MSKLTLKFCPDDDDVQRLDIEIEADTFSGQGWCWTTSRSLEEFSCEIATYPLPEGAPATLQMGFDQLEGDDLAGAIEIRQINLLGHLEVKAEVADYYDRRCRVRVVPDVLLGARALSGTDQKHALGQIGNSGA